MSGLFSLCMGNQARLKPGRYGFVYSTRNFPNRLGDGAKCLFVFSAENGCSRALWAKNPKRGGIIWIRQQRLNPCR